MEAGGRRRREAKAVWPMTKISFQSDDALPADAHRVTELRKIQRRRVVGRR